MTRSWSILLAAAASLLLLTITTVSMNGEAAAPVASTMNDLHGLLFPRPTIHATAAVARLHPLLHFAISHSDSGAPLHGFHPSATKAHHTKVKQQKVQEFWHQKIRHKDGDFEPPAIPSKFDHNFHSSEFSVFPTQPFRVSASGHIVQPFPDRLTMTIRLPTTQEDTNGGSLEQSASATTVPEIHTNILQDIELHVLTDLFDWNAEITPEKHHRVSLRSGDNEEIATMPHLLTSYRGEFSTMKSSGWIVITLHADGRFQATVHEIGGETYEINVVEAHYAKEEHDSFTQLHETSFQKVYLLDTKKNDDDSTSEEFLVGGGHGMMIHTHSATIHKPGTHYQCGVDHHESEEESTSEFPKSHTHSPLEDLKVEGLRVETNSAEKKSRNSPPTPVTSSSASSSRRLLAVTPWFPGGCYTGDSSTHRLSVGIVADVGYYESWSSDPTQTQAGVNQLFSLTSNVYKAQVNLIVTQTDLLIYTTLTAQINAYTGQNINERPPCANDINYKLAGMLAMKDQLYADRNTIWHFLSNCYPSGLVGVSYISALCQWDAVGTSSKLANGRHWEMFMHELGHNLGGLHTFGQGGIMDYADSQYPVGSGDYQFAPDNKGQICPYLQTTFSASHTTTPYCYQTVASGPVCGNGIVETGETCDDTSSCCDSTRCQLKAGMQCSLESACCTGSTCQWKISTTSCGSGATAGYCSNGKCQASVCNGAGNTLAFCNVPSATPCKQSCKNTAITSPTCQTSWTSPNINVPDGTICALSPLSKCSSGACVSTVVTYSWQADAWGSCSCSGQQTRTVSCKGSDGSTGTASQCSGTAPALSQSCTAPTTGCSTFTWRQGTWGDCSKVCGGGTQTTTVTCYNVPTNGGTPIPVANSLCTSAAPPSSQSCNTQACQYQWTLGAWSTCSKSCGSGLQTRSATCQQVINGGLTTVDNAYCTVTLPTPVTSQPCNTAACPTYYLSYGPWSTCSATCGSGGTQTRPAYCVPSSAPTTTVATNNCGCGPGTNTPTCPGTTQACNTGVTCPTQATYTWLSGGWGSCSVSSCGGGTQTRTVICIDSNTRTIEPDYQCTTTKPPSLQNCNTAPCATYAWHTDSWGACSVTCGGGSQTRPVTCQQTANGVITTVDKSFCAGFAAPASQQSCNTVSCTASSATYYWFKGDWTSCSRTCGTGFQFRQVYCAKTGSITQVSSLLCTGFPPLPLGSCNTQPCASEQGNDPTATPGNSTAIVPSYTWRTSQWTNCSTICGPNGQRKRLVDCVTSNNSTVVHPSHCNAAQKPTSTSSCSQHPCPTFWFTSDWSACTMPCQGGIAVRRVECRLVSGSRTEEPYDNGGNGPSPDQVDDSQCNGLKPTSSSVCNLDTCPTWSMAEWSDCSAKCGDGFQTRNATCEDPDTGRILPDLSCAFTPMPQAQRACEPILPCGYWTYDPTATMDGGWSQCSRPCSGGNQTRAVTCVLVAGTSPQLDANQNPDNPCEDPTTGTTTTTSSFSGPTADTASSSAITIKPPSTQSCNIDACPDYYWDVRDYSTCSVSCGSGSQTGTVMCIRSSDDSRMTDESLCLGDKPSATRACNTQLCPKYQYLISSEWTPCDVECGEGRQTRQVMCVNTAASATEAVKFDLCSSGGPPPANVQNCSVAEAVCYGLKAEPDPKNANFLTTNGRCVDNQCQCRSGFTSTNCTVSPQLTVVTTSMDPADESQPTTALAFGDKIEIRWDSSASQSGMESVSIFLATIGEDIPLSQYIAIDIPNSGQFLWTIGTNFIPTPSNNTALGKRAEYRFVVWYSPATFASTRAVFQFDDPCAYHSCGLHGVCRVGIPPPSIRHPITAPAVLTLPNRMNSQPMWCECFNGYEGTSCQISPCTILGCSSDHSACQGETVLMQQLPVSAVNYSGPVTLAPTIQANTLAQDSPFTNLCNCTDGYQGNQCRTPSGLVCEAKCKNGGDLQNVVSHLENNYLMVDSCGTCKCRNQWAGEDCSQCKLKCNSGTPSSDCNACSCGANSGYFGTHCQCRYYVLTLHFHLPYVTSPTTLQQEWFDPTSTDAARRRSILQLTLRNDLILAACQMKLEYEADPSAKNNPGDIMIDVVNMQQASSNSTLIMAEARFSLECDEISWFNAQQDDFGSTVPTSSNAPDSLPRVSPSAIPVMSASRHGQPTLLEAYNGFAALFSNLDSPIYRGLFTSQLDQSQIILTAKDPSGQDVPVSPPQPTDPFYISKLVPTNPNQPGGDQPGAGGDAGGSSSESSVGGSGLSWTLLGIVIGCAALGLLLIIGACFLLRHRRRQRHIEIQKRLDRLDELGVHHESPNPAMMSISKPPPTGDVQMYSLQPMSAAPSRRETPPPPPPPIFPSSGGSNNSDPYISYTSQGSPNVLATYPAGDPSFSLSDNTIQILERELKEPTVYPSELRPSLYPTGGPPPPRRR